MRFKIHTTTSNVTIKAKLAFGEKLNERELDYLLHNKVPGFFEIAYDGKKQLTYEAPCMLTLAKYLKESKLEERSFWKIMIQMLDVEIAAKSSGLYPEHLLMKPDMVFLDENTLKMYFVYQPVSVAKEMTDDLFAVIHDMIYQELKKEGGVGQVYLIDFQNYLKQGDYRLEHVRQYIMSVVSGNTSPGTGRMQQRPEKPEDLEQYTVMLGSGGNAGNRAQKNKCMHLIRVRTNERTTFSEEVVKIGRSSQNTYCITGNASIGRNHAAIIKRGETCYLKDLGSVNGTSVNGVHLGGNQACKLKSGDKIQLADEEFVFEFQ